MNIILVPITLILSPAFSSIISDPQDNDQPDLDDSDSVAQLLSGISGIDDAELNVVMDFNTSSQYMLPAKMFDGTVFLAAMSIYSLDGLRRIQEGIRIRCPLFIIQGDENLIDNSTEEIMPELSVFKPESLFKSPLRDRSIFVWISSVQGLDEFLGILDDTVVNCTQRIDVGAYSHHNRFYFYVGQDDSLLQTLFKHPLIRDHPRVASIKKVNHRGFAFHTWDFFLGKIRTRFFWRLGEEPPTSADSLFTDRSDFLGHTFTVGTLPWVHFVVADAIPETDPGYAPTNLYANYSGYEISILETAAEKLNFKYSFINAADQLWGDLVNNSWNGLTDLVRTRQVDWICSDILFGFSRSQMFETSTPFDTDFMGFITPLPHPRSRYLALVLPFSPVVWAMLPLALAAASLAKYVTANVEGGLDGLGDGDGRDKAYWGRLGNTVWFSFGTLFLQSLTRDKDTSSSQLLRFLIGLWALFCLIMTVAYAGNVKAFLTTPVYTKPITTLVEVLNSGLPWEMVLYGEEEEQLMESSTDPVLERIWRGKKVVDFSPVPNYEDVFHGKAVFIDYKTGVELAVNTRYSTPDGRPLVLLAPDPIFMVKPVGWGFDRFNPGWGDTISKRIIRRVTDAGLITKWKQATFAQMKAANAAVGILSAQATAIPGGKGGDDAVALGMGDMQGLVYICAAFAGIAVVCLVAEIAVHAWVRRRLRTFGHRIDVIQYGF